jgi:hypothetical protein
MSAFPQVPTIVKARNGADLLSVIPHQIGFAPSDSLVVVALAGPRGRIGVTARLDLADIRHPVHGPALAEHVAGVVADDNARGAVIVRYAGPNDPPVHRDAPVRAFAARIRERVDYIDVWDVGKRSYQRHDPETWHPRGEGGSLERLRETIPMAAYTALGSAPADSREAVAVLPSATDEDMRRARRAASRTWDQRTQAGGLGVRSWRERMLGVWREAFGPLFEAFAEGRRVPRTDPRVLGAIAAAMGDGVVREAILTVIAGEDDLADRVVADGQDRASVMRRRTVLDPRGGPTVDEDRGEAAEILLTLAAVHAIARRKGHLFGGLAWLAWVRGDGVRAKIACERAAACPGDIPLAAIVSNMMQEAISPRRPARAIRLMGETGNAA